MDDCDFWEEGKFVSRESEVQKCGKTVREHFSSDDWTRLEDSWFSRADQ